jgi:hypothetical protein
VPTADDPNDDGFGSHKHYLQFLRGESLEGEEEEMTEEEEVCECLDSEEMLSDGEYLDAMRDKYGKYGESIPSDRADEHESEASVDEETYSFRP